MALHHTKAKQMERLKAKLGVPKVKAIYMLLAIESREVQDGDPKTNEQIAENLNIGVTTLYKWKKNEDFITLKNLFSDMALLEFRSVANKSLMSLIDNSQPSVKALDLYFRRFGLLTERHETVAVESQDANTSNEKIEESMAELDELLEEKEGE